MIASNAGASVIFFRVTRPQPTHSFGFSISALRPRKPHPYTYSTMSRFLFVALCACLAVGAFASEFDDTNVLDLNKENYDELVGCLPFCFPRSPSFNFAASDPPHRSTTGGCTSSSKRQG